MKNKMLLRYLLITFAITYTAWWSLALLTNLHLVNSSQGLFTLIHAFGGFGPTIAAIIVLPDKSLKAIIRFTFSYNKKSTIYLIFFCLMQGLVIGVSSRETNPAIPWIAIPVIMASATFIGGGNEELGWRGIMQPELEKHFSFPVATIITGSVWMLWHIPLWFVIGASQQNINYGLYCIYGLILSFWLAVLYKKSNSVFFCAVFHGFSNLMLSLFVIKVNLILILGLATSMIITFIIYRRKTQPINQP